MEITCKKCDGKNPLGAIYCRSCGEKLDVNDLKPNQIKKSNSGFKINYLVFYRLIRLGLTTALLALVVCAFWPREYSVPEETENKTKRYENLSVSFFGRVRGDEDYAKVNVLRFSEDDFHYAIHKEMETYETAEDLTAKVALKTEEVSFKFVEGESAMMISHEMGFNIFGMSLPIHQAVKVNIVSSEEGFELEIARAWQGIIPLPEQLNALVLSRLESACLADGDDFHRWLDSVTKIGFELKKVKVKNEKGKSEEVEQRQLVVVFDKEKK